LQVTAEPPWGAPLRQEVHGSWPLCRGKADDFVYRRVVRTPETHRRRGHTNTSSNRCYDTIR